MFSRLNVKLLFTGLTFLFLCQPTVPQIATKSTFLTFDQLTDQLENKYQVQFFYKSEWFEMRNRKLSILIKKIQVKELYNYIKVTKVTLKDVTHQ